ncbi:conserved hypothetical protein; putative exported protein [Cupriavidus taiwanensis]|nr:hypothetical protein [Cupriavidus taiwanensis]SOZ13676.1 conserved hypothetical protein; putative exported protein [Cupriavidus taiwanensis]SOZ23912.1 conserved hypothetical protein; putative exported protein [Cupriavidus taiwanensis]SOZ44287.1 conserved hypothetical protein; putative exported protein [Cupriavidus taiwanensis]
MGTAQARMARAAGLAVLAGVLALGFVGYLRPAFMVDLTNMVLAWCG